MLFYKFSYLSYLLFSLLIKYELKGTITSQSNKLRVQETLTNIKFNIYS